MWLGNFVKRIRDSTKQGIKEILEEGGVEEGQGKHGQKVWRRIRKRWGTEYEEGKHSTEMNGQ